MTSQPQIRGGHGESKRGHRRRARAAAYVTAAALLAGLLSAGAGGAASASAERGGDSPTAPAASGASASGASAKGPASGGPGSGRAAVPQGRFYLQNDVSGHDLSGSAEFLETTAPKGDEDHQQWEWDQPEGSASGKLRNPTRDNRCAARGSDAKGERRLVLRDCSGPGTEWEPRAQGTERYQFFEPGTATRLWGDPVRDGGRAMPARLAEESGPGADWYLTPVDPARQPAPKDPAFDDATFLTAHNAFNNMTDAKGAAAFPNQSQSIAKQLNGGVRALMLDAYQFNGRVRMCHGLCLPTSQPMSDVLGTLATFLRENPDAVLTVFVEDKTAADDLAAEIGDDLGTGGALDGLLFRPDKEGVKEKGWPRLSTLVDQDKRLLLLTDDTRAEDQGRKTELGFQYANEWTTENYWSMGAGVGEGDWTCRSRWDDIPLHRDEPGFHRLFVMNHFRDTPVGPTPGNDNAKALDRAERFCAPAARKKPNYLAVDMYEAGGGAAVSAVEALNAYTYHGPRD